MLPTYDWIVLFTYNWISATYLQLDDTTYLQQTGGAVSKSCTANEWWNPEQQLIIKERKIYTQYRNNAKLVGDNVRKAKFS